MFASLSRQIAHATGTEIPSGIEGSAVSNVVTETGEADLVDVESVDSKPPVVLSGEAKSLEEELTAKLREAEIELSINRAKLSQQRASLEQLQADLERREAAVEEKLKQSKSGSSDKKGGLMDRWKRHLGE